MEGPVGGLESEVVDALFIGCHFVTPCDALLQVGEDLRTEHLRDGTDHLVRVSVGDKEEIRRFVVFLVGEVGFVDEGDVTFGFGDHVAHEGVGLGACVLWVVWGVWIG